MRVRSCLFLLLMLGSLLSCSQDGDTPEAQIRAFIDAGIEAAEDRDGAELHDMLHPGYLDNRGYDRKQLEGLLRVYFLRHKNIHLFSKIDAIDVANENQATVTLHVAMAASVISSVDALAGLRARIYRFELELVRDGKWLLQHASWAPANAADLR